MLNIKEQIDNIKKRLLEPCNVEISEKKYKPSEYEYIVLSGGGIKGIAFTGALKKLNQLGLDYTKIKGIAGISAGSIIASLLAIGYTPDELIQVMSDIDFKKIANDGEGYIKDIYNLIKKWGMCPGKYVVTMLGDLIAKKTGNPDYTIKDLKKDRGIDLVIGATNMNFFNMVYFYADNPVEAYSNIPIRIAIRMSMGIPYLFKPYNYNDCYFVDGGTLCNYPLHVFDGEYPGDPNAVLNQAKSTRKVIGLKLMTDDMDKDYQLVKKQEIDNLLEYSMAYINMFLTENDRHVMTPSFWNRTIIIVTPNYPLNKFDITDQEKQDLIKIGNDYTNEFFN